MEQNNVQKIDTNNLEKKKVVVQDIAKKNNNINNDTASINEEKKVVDINYVLQNNPELNFKINNIRELGFGMDYIEDLVTLHSNFNVGDDVSVLEGELEKVFDILVRTISDTPNGIVLNSDGTIDEIKSKEQKDRIDAIYNITDRTELLDEKSKEEIINNSRKQISKINDNNILLNRNYANIYNNFKDILNDKGISEEEQKELIDDCKEKDKYTNFSSVADCIIVYNLFDLNDEFRKLNEQKLSMQEIEEILKPSLIEIVSQAKELNKEEISINTERDSKFLNEIENLSVEKVIKWFEEFVEARNQSDAFNKLSCLKTNDFSTLPESQKAKVLKAIAKAVPFMEKNKSLNVMVESISQSIWDDGFSIQNLIEAINQNSILKNVKDYSDLEKFIEENNLSKSKVISYAQAIETGVTRENRSIDDGIYAGFTKKLQLIYFNDNTNKKEAALQILALYKELSLMPEDLQVKDLYINSLTKFIYYNKDLFNLYTRTYDGIFKEDIIDIDKINEVLENEDVNLDTKKKGQLDEYVVNTVKNIEKNKDKIKRLEDILNQEIGDKEKKEIIELLKNIDMNAISSKIVKKINDLGDSKVIDILKNKQFKLAVSDIDIEQSKEDIAIQEAVLLIESKVKNAKGTSMYGQALEERNEIYKNFTKLRKNYLELKKDENLYEEVERYEDNLLIQSLKSSIEKKNGQNIDANEKKNFTKFLLVALNENNDTLSSMARNRLKQMYPDLDEEYDIEKYKTAISQKIYGKKLSNEDVDKVITKTRDNLKSIIITNKSIEQFKIKKIKDLDIDKLIQDKGEYLDVSAIDLVKSDLQNLFGDSIVDFSASDEKSFKNIYNKGIQNSIINSEKEANLHAFISYNLAKKVFLEDNKNFYKNNEQASKKMDIKIADILEKNPEFNRFIDKKGNINEEILERNKEFRMGLIQSELLSKVKDALVDQTMSTDEKIRLGIIVYTISNSKENNDKETKKLFNKLAVRIFEMTKTGDLIDKKGNINEKNILNYYNQTNRKKMKSTEDLIEYINTSHTIFKTMGLAQNYSKLKDEEFKQINNNYETEEERRVQKDKLIKNKIIDNLKDKRSQKYMAYLERKVKLFDKKDIDKIKNPYIAAIYYKNLMNKNKDNLNFNSNTLEKEFVEKYPEQKNIGIIQTYNNLKERLRFDRYKIEDKTSIGLFFNSFTEKALIDTFESKVDKKGEETFNLLENNIGNVDKKYIDKNTNVNVNAIWYYKKISQLSCMGYIDKAEKLKVEFNRKLEGTNLEQKIDNIKQKINQQIRDSYNNGQLPEQNNINRMLLDDKEKIFVESFKKISQKVDNLKNYRGKLILKDFCDSTDDNDYKQQQIANLYSRFYESKNITGIEVVKKFIVGHKDEFKDFLNDEGDFSFKNTLKLADKSTDKSAFIYQKMNRAFQNCSKYEKEQKDNAEKIYFYMTSDKKYTSKDKDEVQDAMKSLIENHNVSTYIKQAFKQKDDVMSENVYSTAINKNKDTWRKISFTAISNGIQVIKHLPRVLLGKEKIGEYAYETRRSFNEIRKRVGNKLNKSFKKIVQSSHTKKKLGKVDELKKLPSRKFDKRNQDQTENEILLLKEQSELDYLIIDNKNSQIEKAAMNYSLDNNYNENYKSKESEESVLE